MNHPLDGVRKKLERAEKNIINLNGELNSFIDTGDYRTISDRDKESFGKALQYHSARPVPVEFSVLAGEVLYQLRSSLDHLVWQLVIANREIPTDRSEFPIFKIKPSEKDISQGFKRKIKGVGTGATAIINSLQPYHAGPKAADEPLWILHDLCRIDRHQELVMVVGTVKLDVQIDGIIIHDGEAELLPRLFGFQSRVEMDYKLSPQVAFKQFGSRPPQSVIPGLTELLANVLRIVNTLSREITSPPKPTEGLDGAPSSVSLTRPSCTRT